MQIHHGHHDPALSPRAQPCLHVHFFLLFGGSEQRPCRSPSRRLRDVLRSSSSEVEAVGLSLRQLLIVWRSFRMKGSARRASCLRGGRRVASGVSYWSIPYSSAFGLRQIWLPIGRRGIWGWRRWPLTEDRRRPLSAACVYCVVVFLAACCIV